MTRFKIFESTVWRVAYKKHYLAYYSLPNLSRILAFFSKVSEWLPLYLIILSVYSNAFKYYFIEYRHVAIFNKTGKYIYWLTLYDTSKRLWSMGIKAFVYISIAVLYCLILK